MSLIEKILEQRVKNDLALLQTAQMMLDKNSFKQGYANGFVKGFYFGYKRPMIAMGVLLAVSILIHILR